MAAESYDNDHTQRPPAPLAPRHMAGPAYWETRREMEGTSTMELRRRWRQLRRWQAEGGGLDTRQAEELRAVENEYLARRGSLPS